MCVLVAFVVFVSWRLRVGRGLGRAGPAIREDERPGEHAWRSRRAKLAVLPRSGRLLVGRAEAAFGADMTRSSWMNFDLRISITLLAMVVLWWHGQCWGSWWVPGARWTTCRASSSSVDVQRHVRDQNHFPVVQ